MCNIHFFVTVKFLMGSGCLARLYEHNKRFTMKSGGTSGTLGVSICKIKHLK